MGSVYKRNETTLDCFKKGVHYVGFLQGTESKIEPTPLHVRSHKIQPGDQLSGFESGSSRTSIELEKDWYMTYRGRIDLEVYFEVTYPGKVEDSSVKWFLAFGHIQSMDRLLMLSAIGTAWDIVPKQIINYVRTGN